MDNHPSIPTQQTEHVQPQPQPTQPAGSSLGVLLPLDNKPALIGYYLGVFGLIPFLGLPLAIAAIVLGIIGLKRHAHSPVPGGKGHAITALVLGIFEVVCYVNFFVFISLYTASA